MLMTSPKIPTMRKEALIEGLMLLGPYYYNYSTLIYLPYYGSNGGSYVDWGFFILYGVIPTSMPFVSYGLCRVCDFTYKDFKSFSSKSIFFTLLTIIFVFLFMTPLLYHGLNFSIDTILGYFYKIDFIGVIACLYVVKVICAIMIYEPSFKRLLQ